VNPTAKQQRWQDWQRSRGCHACGQWASIHHCVGRTAKHQKVHIGQWFTIPLCYDCHQAPGGIHHGGQRLEQCGYAGRRIDVEKQIFAETVEAARHSGVRDVPPDDIVDLIATYSR
jgi:hypothetical protein